jgi:hypothetical protein
VHSSVDVFIWQVVNCRGVDVVGIFALAPDLVMLDLNRIIVKQEDMRIIDQLALNNRTKVYVAGCDLAVQRWRGLTNDPRIAHSR